MSLFFGKKRLKSCLRLKRKKWLRPRRQPRPRLPYGRAIWRSHMVLPYSRFWSRSEKVRSSKKKWDLFQLPNIGLVTHDDLLKISIWPRVEKHVLSTPRGSRYDFYGQLDQNLWPSWWKSGKNMKLCQNGLQKNDFWLLRSSPGSAFHFKSI